MISRSRSSISGAADKHTIDFVSQTKIVISGSVRIDVMDDEKGLIIYNTPDGRSKVALMARDGMVWLNQQSIAELFGTSVPNISMHISNIFKDNELEKNSVVKDYLTTAPDQMVELFQYPGYRQAALHQVCFVRRICGIYRKQCKSNRIRCCF